MTVKLMDCLSDEKLVLDMAYVIDSTLDLREHIEKLVAPAPKEMAFWYQQAKLKEDKKMLTVVKKNEKS